MRTFVFAVVALVACGSSTTDAPSGPAPALGQTETGIATWYAATGAGACSFDPSPNDMDVAAMNAPEYAGSGACGSCVEVTGPKGKVTVRIVDLCPECAKGHLDLSQQAFAKLADPSTGKIDIKWTVVACSVSGPVQYHFKDGSSQYWTAIQVRNHKVPITKLEVKKAGGAWTEVQRVDYNYFVIASGVGPGAFSVRITGQGGATLEDSFSSVTADATVPGTKQFP